MVEVVRMQRAVTQLVHPVAMELVEPGEVEVGVRQRAMPAAHHEQSESVETEPAPGPLERSQPVAAPGARWLGGQVPGLLLEQPGHVGPEVVVAVHAGLRTPSWRRQWSRSP